MKKFILLFVVMYFCIKGFSQNFEEPKFTGDTSKTVKVSIGADFAMQYQALTQHADDTTLIPLGAGINLPTANFNINAQLARGIKVNLVTYLSSRHHNEAWVKGGYLLIDQTPFFNSTFFDNLMNYLSLKIGVMEIDYGDEHYRRSDNGNALNNPFVGNYVMDAFTTAPAFEILYRNMGMIAMFGISTANLDPSIAGYNAATNSYLKYNTLQELAYYGKFGFDKQPVPEFRIRWTLSGLYCKKTHSGSLYFGDRTGSRYYLVMKPETSSSSDIDPSSNHLSGNWSPGFFTKDQSMMTNLFVKIKGLEFFGTYEKAKGTAAFSALHYNFWQLAGEGLYRFGRQDQFYGGLRIDHVENDVKNSINRFQAGLGWFLTKNTIAKIEYVDQKDHKIMYYGNSSGFKGMMIEASISF